MLRIHLCLQFFLLMIVPFIAMPIDIRIQSLKFDSGFLVCELPIDLAWIAVIMGIQCMQFCAQLLNTWYPSIQTFTCHDIDCNVLYAYAE